VQLKNKHKIFNESKRKHILIITNHGCHSPFIKVTTDTGGQNFYVNDFSNALIRLGYKITILNRGGYKHPETRKLHKGIVYYDNVWGKKGIYCRLIYLEDGENKFIPKERLKKKNLEKERDFFLKIARKINLNPKKIYFISSHYWDAGILGILINEEIYKRYHKYRPHIWTPHSLGILKRANYKKASKKVIKALNFPTRTKYEEKIISTVDGVVATSGKIDSTLAKYKSKVKNHFWCPPGIDTGIFKPRTLDQCKEGINALKENLKLNKKEVLDLIKTKIVFLEVSRTAVSKQKDIVLKAFSRINNYNNAVLIMLAYNGTPVHEHLMDVHNNLKNKDNIILFDRYLSKEEITQIFSFANAYITASLMEGWGMAAQEAAASHCAIISSKFVPFATEVLKDNALIVNKNYPRLYAEKMDILIQEPHLREKLARKVYKITSKHYSWIALSNKLISKMKKRGRIK
jgi:glycosyltransferase involved in cell wall biosynthesis